MTTDNFKPVERKHQAKRKPPFLGEIRAIHHAGVPRNAGFQQSTVEAVEIIRLEQWNGKEWIFVHEIHP